MIPQKHPAHDMTSAVRGSRIAESIATINPSINMENRANETVEGERILVYHLSAARATLIVFDECSTEA